MRHTCNSGSLSPKSPKEQSSSTLNKTKPSAQTQLAKTWSDNSSSGK